MVKYFSLRTNYYALAFYNYSKLFMSYLAIAAYFLFFRKKLKLKGFFFFKERFLNKKKIRNFIFISNSFFFTKKSWKTKNLVFLRKRSCLWKKKMRLYKFFLFRASSKELSFKGSIKKYRTGIKQPIKKQKRVKFFNFKKNFFRTLKVNREYFSKIIYKDSKKNRLLKFARSSFFKKPSLYSTLEMSLLNILSKSLFSVFYADCIFLLNNSLVYVNGVVESRPLRFLKIFDRVQLLVFKGIFSFFKTQVKLLHKYANKIKKKVWRLKKNRFDFFKQRSKLIPNWANKFKFSRKKIPNYLEVDTLTLTSVILFKPSYVYHYNSYFYKFISYRLFRLYGWLQ